jgi:glycosyltransferase involved in cell wall biosynthesis
MISCIMPTADRRRFVPQAIRCFLSQDYPQKELIIVDNGVGSVADLVPEDPCIRYFRVATRQPVGALRNFACREARGEILVHCDDAHGSVQQRLTYQKLTNVTIVNRPLMWCHKLLPGDANNKRHSR